MRSTDSTPWRGVWIGLLGLVAAVPLVLGEQPSDRVIALPPVTDLPGDETPPESPGESPDPAMIWYQPSHWFSRDCWEGGIEVGLNGSEGNSESLSLRVGGNVRWEAGSGVLTLNATYHKASADAVETQNNALFAGRYEWELDASRWTLFINDTLEYDEFRAFDLRWATNAGVGYRVIKSDLTTLTGRVGSGVSQEIGGPDDSYVLEAVFGADLIRQLTRKQKISAKFDYYPAWDDFEDYRLQFDVGWEILLDEATNLSLKIAVIDRYDSTPDGFKPNDIDYSLLLLWRL